jgi:hypothetical protein
MQFKCSMFIHNLADTWNVPDPPTKSSQDPIDMWLMHWLLLWFVSLICVKTNGWIRKTMSNYDQISPPKSSDSFFRNDLGCLMENTCFMQSCTIIVHAWNRMIIQTNGAVKVLLTAPATPPAKSCEIVPIFQCCTNSRTYLFTPLSTPCWSYFEFFKDWVGPTTVLSGVETSLPPQHSPCLQNSNETTHQWLLHSAFLPSLMAIHD